MKVLKKIDEYLEEYFLVLTLIVMTVLTLTQIVMRLWGASLTWSEELVRFIFLWQVWVGVSYATKKSKHLRVDLVVQKLSPEHRKVIITVVNLIWLGFSLYMVYQSATVVHSLRVLGLKSAALRIPMWIPNLSVTVGFALMSYRLVQNIYLTFAKKKGETA